MIEYLTTKEFFNQLRKLKVSGGTGQKIAARINAIIGEISSGLTNPFHGIPLTNHGESRIKHCIKYDLNDGYRLITIKDSNFVALCFVGNHDECDRWLKSNTGYEIIRDKHNTFTPIRRTTVLNDTTTRPDASSDGIEGKLVNRIKQSKLNELFGKNIGFSTTSKLLEFDHNTDATRIEAVCNEIEEKALGIAIYDVLISLKSGDVQQAETLVDIYTGSAKPISDIGRDIIDVLDGDSIIKIAVGSKDYSEWINKYISTSSYQDWMLFMHPEQKKIVESSYNGPTKLSGVSGSGKTCVVVNRAARLAKEGRGNILIITLNRSLASLIDTLVEHACLGDQELYSRIRTTSYFELCQELLRTHEPTNNKLYEEVSWKTNEHIDDIWGEYYRCENNNQDAEKFTPVIMSLNSINIAPDKYIRQEMDWIRSAFGETHRNRYLSAERKGRIIGFPHRWREVMLECLRHWEDQMKWVGAIDYLGLATSLHKHINKIEPKYSHILVDEAQDFGTVELEVIRKLALPGSDDLFFCGDVAQSVLPKHNSFKDASIDIPRARSLSIKRNYRNSREILSAAYKVLENNIEEILFDGELDIYDPEYANFSSSKPIILRADSLAQEISCAIDYISRNEDYVNGNKKACITIAGFSFRDIKTFSDKINIPILDGTKGLKSGYLFLSDLEQTKGYEFDTMLILNCNNNVFPPIDMPEGEHYRDACRLYVAMTRAKRDLILSYNKQIGTWLSNCLEYFDNDTWDGYIDVGNIKDYGSPVPTTIHHTALSTLLSMPGKSFIRTTQSQGVSVELQEKLVELVDGQGLSSDGKKVKWPNISAAYESVRLHPYAKRLFGSTLHKEFITMASDLLNSQNKPS